MGLIWHGHLGDSSRQFSTALILVISVLLAQGYVHQIKLIIQHGKTGAVDLKMSQFIFLMDVSTVMFGLSLGVKNGWPLLVLAVTSGITKLIIMYLFHWVKYSPIAHKRRELAIEN